MSSINVLIFGPNHGERLKEDAPATWEVLARDPMEDWRPVSPHGPYQPPPPPKTFRYAALPPMRFGSKSIVFYVPERQVGNSLQESLDVLADLLLECVVESADWRRLCKAMERR